MTVDAASTDEREFETLIGPLIEPALRLAFSMLGDRAEAEDATQDAITRAWRKLSQLRDLRLAPPGSSPSSPTGAATSAGHDGSAPCAWRRCSLAAMPRR